MPTAVPELNVASWCCVDMMWGDGESKGWAAGTFCGLQFMLHRRQLYIAWTRLEMPRRAASTSTLASVTLIWDGRKGANGRGCAEATTVDEPSIALCVCAATDGLAATYLLCPRGESALGADFKHYATALNLHQLRGATHLFTQTGHLHVAHDKGAGTAKGCAGSTLPKVGQRCS